MAGFVWGVVMWLFYVKADILHESLASSMKDLYISSEKPIKTWKELIPYSNYKWEWYLMIFVVILSNILKVPDSGEKSFKLYYFFGCSKV